MTDIPSGQADPPDKWASWLLHDRHGGDPARQQAIREMIFPIRDQVLQHAGIAAGATVLDIGSGDGLVALAAIPLVGDQGEVIFSDISEALLDHCRAAALTMGGAARRRFVPAFADDLSAISTGSVDRITCRSVLMYVSARARAFEEFWRVLKRGGRFSIYEPISRFGHPAPPHLLWGYDVTPVIDLATRIRAVYGRISPMAIQPLGDFDERDLLRLAEEAGFAELHLELHADISPHAPLGWEAFLNTAPTPLVPTIRSVIEQALSPAEAARLTAHLRPLVEGGGGTQRAAAGYLWGVKA
jgi:arsenite methyltransferase